MTDSALYGIATLTEFLQSSAFEAARQGIEAIFIVASIVLIAFIIVITIRAQMFHFFAQKVRWYLPDSDGMPGNVWQREWDGITDEFQQARPNEYHAILARANSVLGSTLDVRGIPGATLQEKLENMTVSDLRTLNQVRTAYDAARSILENSESSATYDDVWRVLVTYENALMELEETGEILAEE